MFAPNTYIRGQTTGYSARIVTIENKPTDLINLVADHLTPSNTTILAMTKFATATNAIDSSYFGVNINDNTELTATRYIISRSNEGNTSATSATMNSTRSAQVRFTITSNNIVASPVVDVGRTSIVAVNNLINSNSAILSSEDYVTSGGNAKSRYISRRVTLSDGQDAEDLKVYVAAYKPASTNILVFAKFWNSTDSEIFEDKQWTQLYTENTLVSSKANAYDFIEYVYNVPNTAPIDKTAYLNTNNNNIIRYTNEAGQIFDTYKAFAIKIVLLSSDSSIVPRIQDYRAIAVSV
jgi:hypothetical protein